MSTSLPPLHLVVFGRPGSGKSSLAERLGQQFGYELVRTGELLRAAVRRQDFLGKRVEIHLEKGDLVPDRLIFALLEQSLEAPGEKKLLFDGFPRTLGQVQWLEQFEERLNFKIEAFLEIAVSREEAEARMIGRWICPTCGATYHDRNMPPRVPGLCDRDGTRLERRRDDTPEVVHMRQQVYDDHAGPALEFCQTHHPELYLKVNGEQGPDQVFADACRVLRLIPSTGSATGTGP